MAVRATYRTRSRSYPRGGIAMIFLRSVSDRSRSWIALALIVGALFGLRAADAGAATIVVNTLSDQNNTGPECSLREAILSANADVNTGGCTGSGGYGDDTITVCEFTGNQATGAAKPGGGVSVATTSAVTTISGSLFTANTAVNDGGAFASSGSGGSATIRNSTFVSNSAEGSGGAIFWSGDASSTLFLNNVTITSNTADSNASGGGDGGSLARGAGVVNVGNSIIANNSDLSASTKEYECSTASAAAVVSEGYNLICIRDAGGCTGFLKTGDQSGWA